MEIAQKYRRVALDCLQLAEAARDPNVRDQMVRLAELWARLADRKDPRDQQAA